MKTIIIGDPHSCLDEINLLLQKCNYSSQDKIIVVGDIFDRGPEPIKLLRKLQELNAISVLGNHEQKYIKWDKSNKKIYDPQPFYKDLTDEDREYIYKMPLWYKLPNDEAGRESIVVHGGLRPNVPLEKQTLSDCCYLRYVDKDFNQVSIRKILKDGKEGISFWTKYWTENINVIYGHCVHSFTDVRIDKNEAGGTCYGLDTGCCFGGFLSCLIWETKEIVQVKAAKVYYESKYADLDI